ncbi:hypothetical protein ACGF3G_00750 [Streptomyces sp. NPDC048179]|uniref:hypothetical protein n=1 Tax=Streptomyces sp. NPDC048179 TaxID=3365506 RepID=UPI003719784E
MTAGTIPSSAVTPEQEGKARAYLAGIAYGFGLDINDWVGLDDTTATTTDAEGTTLIHTGGEAHPFDAVVPCARHRQHRVGVTWPADLDKVRDDTAACSALAPATTPRLTRRAAEIWLITRVGEARQPA